MPRKFADILKSACDSFRPSTTFTRHGVAEWLQGWRERHSDARTTRDALRRSRAQFEAIGRIGQAGTLLSGELEMLARDITEIAAHTLGCERVNVWRFDEHESELHCIDSYEHPPGTHSAGQVLREMEFRKEFDALKAARYIAVDDALTDPRIAGYVESYIKPFGITAILDTAIRVPGQNLGVVCFEHVGRRHSWTRDEIAFAEQVADKLALGIMSSMRVRAEEELRASEVRLADAQAVAKVGSWELDHTTRRLHWSDETYRIFGVDRASYTPSYEAFFEFVYPDDREMVERRHLDAVSDRSEFTVDHRIIRADGSVRVLHERGKTFYDGDRAVRSVGTVQDISERKNGEDALAYRDRVLHAVTTGTARMVATDTLAAGVGEALGIVGESLGVERVLVIENPESGNPPAILRHAWEAPNVPVRMQPVGIGHFLKDHKAIEKWREPLKRGRPVLTTLAETEGGLRDLFESLGNKSILLVPIFVNERLWGNIGIDDCKVEREWTTIEIDTLATFAQVIGGLIERDAARRETEFHERQLRVALDAMPVQLTYADLNTGKISFMNRKFTEVYGYRVGDFETVEDWIEHAYPVPTQREHAAKAWHAYFEHLTDTQYEVSPFEVEVKCKDGTVKTALNGGIILPDAGWALATFIDISERKRAEERVAHMARFDELTGLANRRVFVEAIEAAIARAGRTGEGFAVIYLDLDHFKDVNDTLGHPVGDELLRSVATRLEESVRKVDTVARFGGDEFAVLATDVGDPTDLAPLADKLLAAIAEPFDIEGSLIRTGTSIGIAVYGKDSANAESLLSHADVALYRAKTEGRGTYRFFTEIMDAEVRERVRLAADLREAIANNELFLLYQPQVDAQSNRIIGIEALVRWHHPQLGLLPPADFVATAERNGLAAALGHWVLAQACRQIRAWLDDGIPVPSLAVNLSALQFKAPVELEHDIDATLAAAGVEPRMIELELTETAMMNTSQEHDALLQRLRKKGYRLTIDDFGTGYSSLAYLRRLPVDRVKVAQTFIADIATDTGAAMIVKAAISMAEEFGLAVISEGVETPEQLALLRSWGCRDIQGYLYGRPMAPEDIARHLRCGTITPAGESQ